MWLFAGLEVSERPTKRFEADFLSFSLNDNDEQNSGMLFFAFIAYSYVSARNIGI